MLPSNLRYYAFVSRFVDAVSSDALAQELVRLRRNRIDAPTPITVKPAPRVEALPKAA